MKLGVFYVSYKRDLAWLVYSAQLLFKYLKADFNLTVVVEPDCEEICKTWGLPSTTYHYVKPWPDGYMFAMYQKSIADTYTDADLIMILDSDHMLLEPAIMGQFFDNGRPLIRYKDWDEDPGDATLAEGRRQWSPPTERCLGIPLDRDYMRGPPFLFWRDTFKAIRNRVEDVTGLPFRDVVYSDRPYNFNSFLTHPKTYCDYEIMGLYAAKFEPDRYNVCHQVANEHWPFRVYWSHGDWNPQVRAELDARLHVPEPFDGDLYVHSKVAELVKKHGIVGIVETGTHRGDTARMLGQLAPVVTMEVNEEMYNKTPDLPNVTRLLGDSAQVLPKVVSGIAGPILYYLDAHWGSHSPLLDELRALKNSKVPPVIVIHDFKNPNRPDLGFDTWDIGPYSFELIKPYLDEIYPFGFQHSHNEAACGQRRGVIYIEP